MTLLFSKSRKGAPLLHHKGFTFSKEKSLLQKTVWRCVEYPIRKCLARLHTTDEVVVGEINEHNHSCKHANTTTAESWKDHNRQNKKFQNTHLLHNVICNTMVSEFDVMPEKAILRNESHKRKFDEINEHSHKCEDIKVMTKEEHSRKNENFQNKQLRYDTIDRDMIPDSVMTPEKTIFGNESTKMKYVLVPEGSQQNVIDDQLGELDIEITDILKRKELSDDVKALQYLKILCKYLQTEELSPPVAPSPTKNYEVLGKKKTPPKEKQKFRNYLKDIPYPKVEWLTL
jgi:hypothetical protein